MAKKTKNVNKKAGSGAPSKSADPGAAKSQLAADKLTGKDGRYLWSMSYAPRIDQNIHWFQLLPVAFFAAVVVMLVRAYYYTRPMEQFYWTSGGTNLADFFSFYKALAIVICAVLAIVLLLYRVFTQSLAIKRSSVYIPMLVYSLLVLLSYAFSDYKEFAGWGWNDRFEGTVVLLAYMVMLFYIINTINTEWAVKWVVYPLAVTSAVLGLLGVSQATDHDFFRTVLGQKLITPNQMTESGSTAWQLIDQAAEQGKQFLEFTFQNKEIYQTVYNINYVSFYLTLLLPLFGLLFIRTVMKGKEEPIWKKILWGLLFALLLFNLIGSASSGGFLGMGVVVVLAFILLNKRILHWWKPVAALLVITVIIGGVTYERWSPELNSVFAGMLAGNVDKTSETEEQLGVETNDDTDTVKGHLDYLVTDGNDIKVGYEGNELIFTTYPDDVEAVRVTDGDGADVALTETNVSPIYRVDDDRFKAITIRPAKDEAENAYLVLGTDGTEWPFFISDEGVKYLNGFGKLIDLKQTPSVGWADNQDFGSGRGYIWSRTIPMIKDTLLIGHGADTYCIYFPHDDYAGKYNTKTFGSVVNIIVDKPHNMFMGMAVGTGVISVLAFLAIVVLYAVQSFRVLWRRKYDSFLDYTGAGIFLGVVGFVVTGWVDDSSVSVMPMFYALLGTGLAVNMILCRQTPERLPDKKAVKEKTVAAASGSATAE